MTAPTRKMIPPIPSRFRFIILEPPICAVNRNCSAEFAWQLVLCDSSLWVEPLHEPRDRCLTSSGRDGVASLLLNEQLELILRPRIGVGLTRARGAFNHASHRRSWV